MKVITFKVDLDLISQLDRFAVSKNLTRSEVIRRAIRSYIRNHREIRTRRLVIYGGVIEA